MADLWASFPLDPRERSNATMRASDEDRERITTELTAAFAAGRIDHGELDERIAAATAARTLGELPPLVADLVPQKPATPRSSKSLVGLSSDDLRRRADLAWRERRSSAVSAVIWPGLICWAIWLAILVGTGGEAPFPWPLIVNAVTLVHLVRVVATREQIVRDEVERLERKQARQLRWPKGLQ